MTAFVPGSQQRYLRACMVCSIVQTQAVRATIIQIPILSMSIYGADTDNLLQRFLRDGCPNCESFLGLINSTEAVQECTSQVFEGLVTLSDPSTSWVSRWQRLDGYVSGVYAVKVVGTVSLFFGILFSLTPLPFNWSKILVVQASKSSLHQRQLETKISHADDHTLPSCQKT